jgi:hypothetical protein
METQRMSFVPPVWDATNNHYVIELSPAFAQKTDVSVAKDTGGNTVFTNVDQVENITDSVIHNLIDEGISGKWFSKLPSHDQLMKRVKHSFKNLLNNSENVASLVTLLLTPKQITFLWNPRLVATPNVPQFSFDDTESDNSSQGDEVEIPESDLPAVRLVDDSEEVEEEYLLTRLRAARARVEAEQIRMEYFQATGRMPPDSEDE